MQVADAQSEVRRVFMGGFPGQLVSALLWFASAALSTWMSTRIGIVVLVAGGFFIFPTTVLLLRAMGRPSGLSRTNPLGQLAMQVAFTLPFNLPLVAAATLHRRDWFYPALMIVLGSHYLPFAFLYGMREFFGLGLVLILAGWALGAYVPAPYAAGAWFTGALLFGFAFLGRAIAMRGERTAAIGG